MAFWSWSKTAASNATADTSINWAEGQSPSSVNDSARAMMARTAEYRDDISGAIVTGGTIPFYTLTSNQGFTSAAAMNGAMIAFTPHATNNGPSQLNVDGLGGAFIRLAPGVDLPAGTIIAGTPYVATYYSGSNSFFLQNSYFSNPYNIPLGGGLDYWGSTAPNSSFVFPTGQAVSRTTYATLFTLFGATFGVGDGSTTFNLPDKTGRVSAMKEAAATRLTTAVGGVDGATLGSASTAQSKTIAQANLPNVNFTVTDPGHQHHLGPSPSTLIYSQALQTSATPNVNVLSSTASVTPYDSITTSVGTGISVNSGGSGTALAVVQPTIVCNYILRII